MASETTPSTSEIKQWKSIVVLIVFVLANLSVLFPQNVPIPIPIWLRNAWFSTLAFLRIIPPRNREPTHDEKSEKKGIFVRPMPCFPVNMVTGPLISVLFLLAVTAIDREEVKNGTLGTDNIEPIDIMAFFFTLAYIAISIDASGLIRWLAFKVLQKAGKNGRLLYFYLYCFFFALSCCIGNDPVILSGTAFLAYMFRISSNIDSPRAWIHAQFAVANMGSAVLVTSNPTNLVLAGAFKIKFITYTANMIVPVFVTAIILFPFLLSIFDNPKLIPRNIEMRVLSDKYKDKQPDNPNVPNARAQVDKFHETEEGKQMLIAEIMNPWLDRKSAGFGAIIMAATLITILVSNATDSAGHTRPVFWITAPAAFVMLIWDLTCGYLDRERTRALAKTNRELAAIDAAENRLQEVESPAPIDESQDVEKGAPLTETISPKSVISSEGKATDEKPRVQLDSVPSSPASSNEQREMAVKPVKTKTTLQSLLLERYRWSQETFPTSTVVLTHLPWALVPFALCMFVLVQALVNRGWVEVLAYGWKHWVDRTGVVGAIGGMAFLSVVLCNFAGTNIGTTILLSRIIQVWGKDIPNTPISERQFWATVYSMALGVNFGAFSTALSASLAGLLWRDILGRKRIRVTSLDFARFNLPIIAITMVVGCVVLIGEVYITRSSTKIFVANW